MREIIDDDLLEPLTRVRNDTVVLTKAMNS